MQALDSLARGAVVFVVWALVTLAIRQHLPGPLGILLSALWPLPLLLVPLALAWILDARERRRRRDEEFRD